MKAFLELDIIRIASLKEVRMEPIGMLMKEHRLIERMIALLEKEMERRSFHERPDTQGYCYQQPTF